MNTDFFQLTRIKVTLMVGLSAFAGACLASSGFPAVYAGGVLIAVFLSAGCSALNQIQEAHADKLMVRTKNRPIPSGRMRAVEAFIVASVFLAAAFFLIFHTKNQTLLILGISSVVIYNVIYTPLKKITPFALPIGSLSGALPPLIGFTTAGGSIFDVRIIVVSGILYLWQTPHFALLSHKYADDYENAGFKTISKTYGNKTAQKIIDIWMFCYCASLVVAVFAGLYINSFSYWLHGAFAIITYISFFFFHNKAFTVLNVSAALFFMLLVADRLSV